MKKISTLFAFVAVALLTGNVFAASIFIMPSSASPGSTNVTPTSKGIFTDPNVMRPDEINLKSAMTDFKSLSKFERKDRFKAVKTAVKQYKKDKRDGKAENNNTLLEVIVTILIPPLGVFLHEGEINNKFWIDLILTLLFYVPGLVYGLIVVLAKS